jgi:two-component system osmolarity sensor histidine kinase EnvZ
MPRLPAQLTIRLSLMLCVLLGANTYGFVELYRYHIRYHLAPSMGEALAGWVESLRACDSQMTDDQREQWLQRVSKGQRSHLDLVPPAMPIAIPPQTRFITIMALSLRQIAGNDLQVEANEATRELLIYFRNDGRQYRLTVPGTAIRANDVWPFLWLIAANILIVWLSVMFAVWQINEPLRRSAEALASSSNQLAEIDLPASAPKEFAVFAQRFNELARKLAAQERERALLLAGVSHDLRAPLTRIQLRADLMATKETSGKSGLSVDAASMRHIIDQFLDYQRGNIEANATLIDLRMTSRDVVERYQEAGRDVRFSGEDSALVLADPSAIERILGNLIDNALDYGSEPIEVQLGIEGGHALLQVRDHGPGIEEHQVSRLLQPFERLDDSRSLHGHCGLGLSIVNRLIKELRGSLSFGNHVQGGLIVSVRLPIRSTAQ